MSAWTALRRADDVRELRPWLHRIAHNTSLNARRVSGYDYEQLHDALQGSSGSGASGGGSSGSGGDSSGDDDSSGRGRGSD